MKEFTHLVYIGRFQPFHAGHEHIITEGLRQADTILVGVGSANRAPDMRNPWTFEERRQMILASFSEDDRRRLFVFPINDQSYNDIGWATQVRDKVRTAVVDTIPGYTPHNTISGLNDTKVGLIGYEKDGTSYYLKMFPEWRNVKVKPYGWGTYVLSATDIRKNYFAAKTEYEVLRINFAYTVPIATLDFLSNWFQSPMYNHIREEHEWVLDFKKQWANSPYPPTFCTADAVVTQSGHMLMVERKSLPGKGLTAFPGGYIHVDETFEDAMIRELVEETRLKVPAKVLKGCIVKAKMYDAPNRSVRGRVNTMAYHIKLPDSIEFPKVKAASDAKRAIWAPISTLLSFEDHEDIKRDMLGLN